MDRQTLRDWAHRYNADGVDGLVDRPRPGRRPRLDASQQKQVAQWVDEGPDLARDGVVRWRCADLVKRIKVVFDIDLQEGAVGRLLKKLGYSRLSGRPLHPQSDLKAQQVFKRMARPVCKGDFSWLKRSASTYPVSGLDPGQDGYSRASVPHRLAVSSTTFKTRISGAPVGPLRHLSFTSRRLPSSHGFEAATAVYDDQAAVSTAP